MPSDAQKPCSLPSSSPEKGNEDDTALPIRTVSELCAVNGSKTAPKATSSAERRLAEAFMFLPRLTCFGLTRNQRPRPPAIAQSALAPLRRGTQPTNTDRASGEPFHDGGIRRLPDDGSPVRFPQTRLLWSLDGWESQPHRRQYP